MDTFKLSIKHRSSELAGKTCQLNRVAFDYENYGPTPMWEVRYSTGRQLGLDPVRFAYFSEEQDAVKFFWNLPENQRFEEGCDWCKGQFGNFNYCSQCGTRCRVRA